LGIKKPSSASWDTKGSVRKIRTGRIKEWTANLGVIAVHMRTDMSILMTKNHSTVEAEIRLIDQHPLSLLTLT
jgi:hypothetical protein